MANHPTKDRLLDAAVALAAERPLFEVSVDDVVAEAGVAKGTFYVHFADRRTFMVALHERFDAEVGTEVAAATAGMAPGPDRLIAGAQASMDACREREGVKSVLIETRFDPAVSNAVARRNEAIARAAIDDFRALGAESPEVAARLFVAMVAEAALMETELGRRDDAIRRAVAAVVGST